MSWFPKSMEVLGELGRVNYNTYNIYIYIECISRCNRIWYIQICIFVHFSQPIRTFILIHTLEHQLFFLPNLGLGSAWGPQLSQQVRAVRVMIILAESSTQGRKVRDPWRMATFSWWIPWVVNPMVFLTSWNEVWYFVGVYPLVI